MLKRNYVFPQKTSSLVLRDKTLHRGPRSETNSPDLGFARREGLISGVTRQ